MGHLYSDAKPEVYSPGDQVKATSWNLVGTIQSAPYLPTHQLHIKHIMANARINILVTGASGELGRLILQDLIKAKESNPNIHIIAASRSLDKIRHLETQAVEIRHVDFDDRVSLAKAFVGVHRAIVISTEDLGRRHIQHRDAFLAAEDARVQHVIYTSLIGPLPQVPLWEDHFWSEMYLANSKVSNWTVLRNAVYAEVPLDLNSASAAVASGILYSASGHSKRPYIARADCALAAATILLNPQGHEKSILHLTGPAALSNDEIAAVLSEVSGKPVKHISLPAAEYFAVAKQIIPQWFFPYIQAYESHAAEGHDNLVTPTFFKLTGQQSTPFKAVLEANKSRLAPKTA
jgi:NAD(P)H dehydrogenase (quinone)